MFPYHRFQIQAFQFKVPPSDVSLVPETGTETGRTVPWHEARFTEIASTRFTPDCGLSSPQHFPAGPEKQSHAGLVMTQYEVG